MRLPCATLLSIIGMCIAANACWMAERPSATIGTYELRGRIMLDGKPVSGAKLLLYRWDKTKGTATADQPLRTVSDSSGEFDFGPIRRGDFRVVMTSPSGESFDLRVVPPTKKGGPVLLLVDARDDWCYEVRAVHEEGTSIVEQEKL